MLRKLLISLTILSVIIIILISFDLFNLKNLGVNLEQNNHSKQQIEKLTLQGSNTIGESFAPILAKAYLKSQGAVLVREHQGESPVEKYIEGNFPDKNKITRIEIKAHGSSTGFKALDTKSTEIAMSSRSVKSEEKTTLIYKFAQLNEHPIALDALAIITYPQNPIDTLSIGQIAEIFSGEISNWQELGGENQPISLFSRDNNSGTWDTFKTLVLNANKKNLSEKSSTFESSQELVNGVINTPGALGFVGVTYVGHSKLLKVSSTTGETGKKPTGYTIGTQGYPLSRKLYFYTTGNNHSTLSNSFINFTIKNEGQKQAEKVDLISYYPTHYSPEILDKSTPLRYKDLSSLARRITVNFSNNQSKIDESKERRDIERLKNFALQNPGKKIVLVNFSDSPRLSQLKTELENQKIPVLDTLKVQYKKRQDDPIEVWVL